MAGTEVLVFLETVMSLKQAVKGEAQRLGFELVGITTPDPPPHFEIFANWLDAGRQGEMSYLQTDRSRLRRADPRQILPDCRSILVLGMRYPAPESVGVEGLGDRQDGGDAPLTGRVASYAWGADYHEVLPERLKALVDFIEAHVGQPVSNRWYTDTGPILERDLAQRAGLGWIGKNTCLIHPQKGSYFLLAEILLGIELVPDASFLPDRCGTCTRCLEGCPMACILPDRTIDARRCISYLTIELKSAIPSELRSQIGDWVFGCDVCQQVCPWNRRFSEQEADQAFAPRPGIPLPELVHELSLTPQDFNRKFKGNPVKRPKRRGYLRNVAVALGNRAAGSGDPQVIAALARVLQSETEALVRGHAAWALGRVGGKTARMVLEQAAQNEQDDGVQAEIQAALVAGFSPNVP
jgi:epoxyqueuosine reductase